MLKDQLLKLRKQHKKTQEEIAKYLGITRPAYTAYETGKRQPDYESLIKLSKYYDVSLDYLITGEDKPNKDEKNENLFFFDIEDLSEEDLEDIKRHIEYVKWKAKQEKQK